MMDVKETHKERAVRLFREGYNCSQSVFAACAEDCGISEELALRISSSFGGGMGRMREVCGTVSGMLMVAGMKTGSTEGRNADKKAANYQLVRELAEEFRSKNGSIICRDLLGLTSNKPATEGAADTSSTPEKRTEEYYKKRPCLELIQESIEIMQKKGLIAND